jgi:hypothetical protein
MPGQFIPVGAEGIGLDDIRARIDIFTVDLSDQGRAGQVERIKTFAETDAALVQNSAHRPI